MTTITVTTHAQLNALVAEKVMGWTTIKHMGCPRDEGMLRPIPHYSTDLNAAVEVAEKVELTLEFGQPKLCTFKDFHNRKGVRVDGYPPAIAICLAALRCEGVDVELQLQDGN